MEIPIELFSIMLGVSLTFLFIGLSKKVAVCIGISGILIFSTAILTDIIIMGSQVSSSTTVLTTTTYTYELTTFEFTQWHKIIMALIGVLLMIISWAYKDRLN